MKAIYYYNYDKNILNRAKSSQHTFIADIRLIVNTL